MEMDVIQLNHNWNCNEEESAQQSLFPENPGLCDAYRDPELLPRVGDQYQVQIPPLLTKPSYLILTKSPSDGMIFPSTTPYDFLVGLPISLMRINKSSDNTKDPVKSEYFKMMKIFPEGYVKAEVEHMDVMLDDRMHVQKPASSFLLAEKKNEIFQNSGGYCLVPGSLGAMWSELPEASLLLGLYIFGKNLVQVKKFVESKTMGDILEYYYGKFYRSGRYLRWSACRKMRSRRCVYGNRIFTGSRQQELLSRLLCYASSECQNALLEVAKAFGEGKILLEDYVFTLKDTVGLNAFVEAVGIGKGKQDLTSYSLETPKSSQVASNRSEIPVGKACSTLTPLEIINYLTGGYRLSKARSNDLFWEAVWPRLLARGWHSEQPNDHRFSVACRQSLVFLIPGIKKFSRRRLVKGDHYFDSISDVLNRVALNPHLLELDNGADDKGENDLTKGTNLNQEDFPNEQRHCYLKPRTPSRSSDSMKFTIVDTSLVTGEITNVRQLKTLPVDMMKISTSRSDSEESDGDSLDAAVDESDYADNSYHGDSSISKLKKIDFGKGVSFENEVSENSIAKQSLHINGTSFSRVSVEHHKDWKTITCNEKQTRKVIKDPVTQRIRHGDGSQVAKKQRRSTACDRAETSCSRINVSVRPRLTEEEAGCAGSNPDFRENIHIHVDPSQEKLSSANSSSRNSSNGSDECTPSGSSFGLGLGHHEEKPQSRALFDLNLPLPQDAETEPLEIEMTGGGQPDQSSRQPGDLNNVNNNSTSLWDSTSDQSSNLNPRRQSTRNRPPTTKALEAFAFGFLSSKPKRKNRDDFSLQNPSSKPLRRARSRMRTHENLSIDINDFEGEERGSPVCTSNNDMINELQV